MGVAWLANHLRLRWKGDVGVRKHITGVNTRGGTELLKLGTRLAKD